MSLAQVSADAQEGSAATGRSREQKATDEPKQANKKRKAGGKQEKKWSFAEAYANDTDRKDILASLLGEEEEEEKGGKKRKKKFAGEKKVAEEYLRRKEDEAKNLPGVDGMKVVLANHQLYVAMFDALGHDFSTYDSPISRTSVLQILRTNGNYEVLRNICWQVQQIRNHVEMELEKVSSESVAKSKENGSLQLINDLVEDLEKAREICGRVASRGDLFGEEDEDGILSRDSTGEKQ